MRINPSIAAFVLTVGLTGCDRYSARPQNSVEETKTTAPVGAEPSTAEPDVLPQEPVVEIWPEAILPAQQSGTPLPGVNLALGKSYTWSQSPNYSHCTDPGDATQLTDGEFVEGYFWVQKGAVGWQNRGRVEIILDLGDVHPISAVAAHVAGGSKTANVFFPDAVFFASEDGRQFQKIGERLGTDLPDLGDWYSHKYIVPIQNLTVRYIALSLSSNGAYLFADEIEVMEGDAASARTLEGPFVAQEDLGEAVGAVRQAARTDSYHRAEAERILQTLAE
ncbi:MAG: discoidin domain-containing protein, partial [Kiritimatiellia bacterium]|nr:discoidin domain-containing protein [Kiritimatiellia bacterium]